MNLKHFSKGIEIVIVALILCLSLYAIADAIAINRILGSNVVAGDGLKLVPDGEDTLHVLVSDTGGIGFDNDSLKIILAAWRYFQYFVADSCRLFPLVDWANLHSDLQDTVRNSYDSIGVDTDGDDTDDNYLFPARIKKGSNITLSVTGDVLTITGAAGGAGTEDTVWFHTDADDDSITSLSNRIHLKWGNGIDATIAGDTLTAVVDATELTISTTEITDQTIVKADIDTTSTFVFGAAYKTSSAVAGNEFIILTDFNKVTDDTTNWNTAYGWGDHSTQNYLDNDDANVDTAQWNATYDTVSAWDNRGYPAATTADLGIASFATANFSVTAGAVSIKAGGVDSTNFSDSTISETDINWIPELWGGAQFSIRIAVDDSINILYPVGYDSVQWSVLHWNSSGAANDQLDTVVFSGRLPKRLGTNGIDSVTFRGKTTGTATTDASIEAKCFKQTEASWTVTGLTGDLAAFNTSGAWNRKVITSFSTNANGGDWIIIYLICKADVNDSVWHDQPYVWYDGNG